MALAHTVSTQPHTKLATPLETDVFLVSSPLQLINAIEACKYFRPEHKTLCVISEYHERKFMEPLLNVIDWDRVYILEARAEIKAQKFLHEQLRWHNGSLASRIVRFPVHIYSIASVVSFLNEVSALLPPIHRLFIGNYVDMMHQHFLSVNQSRAKEVLVVDDGTATIRSHNMRVYNRPERTSRFKRFTGALRDLLTRRKQHPVPQLTFFTAYDLSPCQADSIIKNDYSFLRSKVAPSTSNQDIWFIGQALVEVGITTLDDYCRMLIHARTHFSSTSQFFYVPHKRESKHLLEQISKRTGLPIKPLSHPLELALCLSASRPHSVASFYSSALYHCALIFGDSLSIKAFHLPASMLLLHQESIQAVYEQMTRDLTSGSFEIVDAPPTSRRLTSDSL